MSMKGDVKCGRDGGQRWNIHLAYFHYIRIHYEYQKRTHFSIILM
jgi:hypothetical protein